MNSYVCLETITMMPKEKPRNKYFYAGPVRKPEGWSHEFFASSLIGLSHVSPQWREKIVQLKDRTKQILSIPKDYEIIFVPGSASGAMDAMFWNMLGANNVENIENGYFSSLWSTSIGQIMRSSIENEFEVCGIEHTWRNNWDTVFVYNSSTTGHSFHNFSFFPKKGEALTFSDVTSVAFGAPLPWNNLDVTVFSCQKCLGGQAGLGIAVLNPKAQKRLCGVVPKVAAPKIFRYHNREGDFIGEFFSYRIGSTPSLLTLLDFEQCLNLFEEQGGVKQAHKDNLAKKELVISWLKNNRDIMVPILEDETQQSPTVICFKLNYKNLNLKLTSWVEEWEIIDKVLDLIKDVAVGIRGYGSADPCFRIWLGNTTPKDELKKLLPWLKWAIIKTVEDN